MLVTDDFKIFSRLSIDTFSLVADWRYDAILELTKTKDFKSNYQFVAQALNMPISQAQKMVERLKSMDLLIERENENEDEDEDEDVIWEDANEDNTIVTDDYTSIAQRNYQKGLLDKARESIDTHPKEERGNSSMIMAISKSQLPKAKEEIKRFRRNMSKILEDSFEEKDDVYQLVIALNSLTTLEDKK